MGLLSKFRPRNPKFQHELEYWKGRHLAEGKLNRGHYEQFYTTVFGLTRAFYAGKKILDVGCGPRGSLEWADMAAERVGLDPLAREYKKLGADKHKMSYVDASSEHIPFATGYFDVVTSFNSLDHVDDVTRTISEMKRIAKTNGTVLLIVEINHPPTATEPITLTRQILDEFKPEFEVQKAWDCGLLEGVHDIYGSVLRNEPPGTPDQNAILCASLRRL